MSFEFTFSILRKKYYELNPDDDYVNDVISRLQKHNGHCNTNCEERIGHCICPCSDYIKNDKCYCNLYVLKEVWKDVVGFEQYYEVSTFGRVRSKQRSVLRSNGTVQNLTSRLLTPYKNIKRRGYLYVYLRVEGKKYNKVIHRLVAEAFLSNPNKLPQVNHKDENTENNRLDNLEWCDANYNDNYGTRNIKLQNNDKINKKVYQYDKQLKLLNVYKSIAEAARITGYSRKHISSDCQRKSVGYKGFIWLFKPIKVLNNEC